MHCVECRPTVPVAPTILVAAPPSAPSAPAPPSWQPDPNSRFHHLWSTGSEWTSYVATHGQVIDSSPDQRIVPSTRSERYGLTWSAAPVRCARTRAPAVGGARLSVGRRPWQPTLGGRSRNPGQW